MGGGWRDGERDRKQLGLGARASLDITSDSNLLHSTSSKLTRGVGRD